MEGTPDIDFSSISFMCKHSAILLIFDLLESGHFTHVLVYIKRVHFIGKWGPIQAVYCKNHDGRKLLIKILIFSY